VDKSRHRCCNIALGHIPHFEHKPGRFHLDSLDRPPSEETEHTDHPRAPKVYIKTFGCQMNVYDSERMSEALQAGGYRETGDVTDADLVILNTCHIREKAAEKVYSDLGRIRDVKSDRAQAGNKTIVAVAGCVAQAEGTEIVRRAQGVDLVVGPQSYHRLGELIDQTRLTGKPIVETEFPDDNKFAHLPERQIRSAPSAFLTVQEGCDKFCSFCVVPYTRGMEFSRPVADIRHEAERLAQRGAREIVLLGQNVNAYHGEGPGGRSVALAALIRDLAQIDDVARLRYMTSHPRDMTDDLIGLHGDEEKLMPFLHLPFQAGADRILSAMNRKHTAQEYLRIVEKVRRARPDIALSTDVIVGFPGETDAEFEETLAVVREAGFAQAFSFKYSPRPGTPAAAFEGAVDDAVKSERLARLQDLLDGQQVRFNGSCVGGDLPVLFEKRGRRDGQLVGRSPYLQLVHCDAPEALIGQIRPVKIASAGQNSLSGVIEMAKSGC
jgi:tRNA-2-methylthio-N6-dimethylallyladenosine synthase